MGSWKDSEALWDWDNRLCNNELLFNQEVHLASRGSLSRWMFTWLMNNISICNRHWRGQPQCQIPAAVQGFWTSVEFTFYFSGETIKNRVSACGWKRTPHASHNLLIHLECVRNPILSLYIFRLVHVLYLLFGTKIEPLKPLVY